MNIDLDKLEALARAAKKSKPHADADWSFAEAITPTLVLDLIAMARAAEPAKARDTGGAHARHP